MKIVYAHLDTTKQTPYQINMELAVLTFPYSYVDRIIVTHPHNYGWECTYHLFVTHECITFGCITIEIADYLGHKGYKLLLENMYNVHQDNAIEYGIPYLKTLGELSTLVSNLQTRLI